MKQVCITLCILTVVLYVSKASGQDEFSNTSVSDKIPVNSIGDKGLNLLTASSNQNNDKANGYLMNVMDQYHKTVDVYTDADAAGNHFAARGRMPETVTESIVPSMNEQCTTNSHSGINCIQCAFNYNPSNLWGGWYFMNGVLQDTEVAPKENWGTYPNAGVNLQGATTLTFWARGSTGGERVEFFCCGAGWDPATGETTEPYPDSSNRIGNVTTLLTQQWSKYTITVKNHDLSYVIGGFGWVAAAPYNNNHNITFYLDDIQYSKSHVDDPHFLVSFKTVQSSLDFDLILRNVAYSYDNAVALIAFLANGQNQRAKLLADAFVYALQHDRYYTDGRLRNAYQGGDLMLPPGWTPNGKDSTVRMPGWYDSTTHQWYEDKVQVSTYSGNVAWTILALLSLYEILGDQRYFDASTTMAEWIEANCRDTQGSGGYTGGYEGWEPTPTKLTYKSTEHNIDLCAVFERLYDITGDTTWHNRANHAKQFIQGMWDPIEQKFWTGTLNDGISINTTVIPLDIQAWSILALKDEGEQYVKALDYAESHHKVGNGYDFNQDTDGIWYEGTGQMAVVYKYLKKDQKWPSILDLLHAAQDSTGGLPAASKNGLTTGFDLPTGGPWLYYNRLHVGATGWLVFAEKGINPFWYGHTPDLRSIPDVKLFKGTTGDNLVPLNDYLTGTTSANWTWSSNSTYANLTINTSNEVNYLTPLSAVPGQDTVLFVVDRIGSDKSILKYSTYLLNKFPRVIFKNGGGIENADIDLSQYVSPGTPAVWPAPIIRYGNSIDSGKLIVSISSTLLTISLQSTLTSPAHIVISATPDSTSNDWDKEIVRVYPMLNDYGLFNTSNDTSQWIYQNPQGTVSKPFISYLATYNGTSGVMDLTFSRVSQGLKMTLGNGNWLPSQSGQWYTVRARVMTNIADNTMFPVVFIYNGVSDKPFDVSGYGPLATPTTWTWLETSLYCDASNSLYPQMVIKNGNSIGDFYIDAIEIIPAKPGVELAYGNTRIINSKGDWDTAADTTGWSFETLPGMTKPNYSVTAGCLQVFFSGTTTQGLKMTGIVSPGTTATNQVTFGRNVGMKTNINIVGTVSNSQVLLAVYGTGTSGSTVIKEISATASINRIPSNGLIETSFNPSQSYIYGQIKVSNSSNAQFILDNTYLQSDMDSPFYWDHTLVE